MTHATDQHIGPTGATHGALVPGRAAPDPRFGHGPYELGTDALADIRDVYEAGKASGDRDTAGKILDGLMLGTLREAGVTAGAYDRKIIGWLARWEPEVMQVFVGLVERAHIAGRRAACDEATTLRALILRACAYIVPCLPPDVANGWDCCQHGKWPCAQTELGWLLRGLDAEAERNRASAAWRQQMAALDEQAGP